MHLKVVIALNTAWNLVNFRAGLIRALIDAGHEVIAVAPPDEYAEKVARLGARFVPLPMDNKGTHPGRDLLLIWRFYRFLQAEKPDVYLSYTVKPNIYGSLAAHVLGIPVINNIAGLGAVFGRNNWLTALVKLLYRFALSRSVLVFFQNQEDRLLFVSRGLVAQEVTDRLPGSGVNLDRFAHAPLPKREFGDPLRFLLIARMLWDKGIAEFVEAARVVRLRHPNVEFCLLGFLDVQNPAAISAAQMDEWVAEGVVEYLGVSDMVEQEIAEADCIVLPSYYREGVPRTLLEAAAIGRPIITTNAIGCRDVVDDGVNGYLCEPRNVDDLVSKIMQMIALTPDERAAMGRQSRQKAEHEFDEKIVVKKYLAALSDVVPPAKPPRC